ncbi:putative FAD-linked oxidoreductase, partial [Haemophilus influenzae]
AVWQVYLDMKCKIKK